MSTDDDDRNSKIVACARGNKSDYDNATITRLTRGASESRARSAHTRAVLHETPLSTDGHQ